MKKLYHDWLKNDPDVVGKEPAITRLINDRVYLELYTARKGNDPKGWCIAIVAVRGKDYIYRSKYDSGSTDNDLEGMADDCEAYINTMWGTKHFVDEAERAYKAQLPFWRKLF